MKAKLLLIPSSNLKPKNEPPTGETLKPFKLDLATIVEPNAISASVDRSGVLFLFHGGGTNRSLAFI